MKNNMLIIKNIALLTGLSSLSAGATPWLPSSDPFTVNRNYNAFLSELPLTMKLPDTELPWSGPYWADKKGSIGFRWQTNEKAWEYSLYSEAQIKGLTENEISLLSPAEKFDILRGKYDLPLTNEIRKLVGTKHKAWAGICTGWSQASLYLDQPEPITLMNSDGVKIPFGSGDIKALASYYYAFPGDVDRSVSRIGTRCDPHSPKGDCRRDVNAGALHILLTNRLGLEKKGLFADMSPRKQIWQHPIYGYESRILGERAPRKDASPLAIREVHVKTQIQFAKETPAEWGLTSIYESARHLNYWLEIDADGQIVGGSYVSIGGGRIPDTVWISEPLTFSHGWEMLNTLVTAKGTRPI